MSARRSTISSLIVGLLALASCSSDPSSSPPPTAPITPTTATTTTTASPASSSPSSGTPTDDTASATSAPTNDTVEPTTGGPPVITVGPSSTDAADPSDITLKKLGEVSNPVDITYRANDPAFYIVSRDGFIVAMRDGAIDPAKLLDISADITAGGEQGLLGLTFSPDGQHGYINYTNSSGGDTEIVEYAVGADGTFDPASRRVVLSIEQPYNNHNGGQVRFGPDGYMYIGMGDGGSGNDQLRLALDRGELLGKMLRIDPTPVGDSQYSIPPDNPFVGVAGARTELWTVGMRNPWRFSFDLATNDLWIADVGQDKYEEVDVAWADEGGGRGLNFGWSAFEATHRFNDDQSPDGAVPPVFEYEHGPRGCSISGGVRYRGSAIPSLYGWYVYGDYCSGEVRALEVLDDRTIGREVMLTTDSTKIAGLSEVAQGPDGEMFALSLDSDQVLAIQPAG